jgi:hypothetical protein
VHHAAAAAPRRPHPAHLARLHCAAPAARIAPGADELRGSEHMVAAAAEAAARESSSSPALQALDPATLKALRREGLQLKAAIKLGRLGVGEGLVEQIRRRWHTTQVRRL